MAVKFQDYYETLGVPRNATAEQIQRAYRKLARQYHPDVNKAADAEARFKQLSEAYEVLKDPPKRQRYDQLGENWKAGQDFRPPPGWEEQFRGAGRPPGGVGGEGPQGFRFYTTEGGDFSDFFEAFFGRHGAFRDFDAGGAEAFERGNGRGRRAGRAAGFAQQGPGVEAELTLLLDDAYRGTTRVLTLQPSDGGPSKSITVRIPPGATEGATIRLAGQGAPGVGGGQSGDLLLRIHIAPHPWFEVQGHDLVTELRLAPWEAALGAKVPIRTLDEGRVTLTVPPGAQSGQRLRLRGKGLPRRGSKDGERGDLYAEIKVVVPRPLTDEERRLFEQLQETSRFDPRAE